jgi:hypothetical protein
MLILNEIGLICNNAMTVIDVIIEKRGTTGVLSNDLK